MSAPTSSTDAIGSPDQVAQMNLYAALAAAKAAYKESGSFSLAGPPELRQFAPTLIFVEPDGDVTADSNQVSVSNGGDNTESNGDARRPFVDGDLLVLSRCRCIGL